MQLGGLPVGFLGFAPAAGCLWPTSGLAFMGCCRVSCFKITEESGCLSRAAAQHFASTPVKGGKGNETYLCLFLVIVFFCLLM